MTHPSKVFFIFLFTSITLGLSLTAQEQVQNIWIKKHTEFADKGNFGENIAISGDYAIVGDYQSDLAYIFHWTGTSWEKQATLKPNYTKPKSSLSTGFGASVAISGDYVAVTSMNADVGVTTGWLHIYKRNGSTWTFQQRLSADKLDFFANLVAMDGDYLITQSEGYMRKLNASEYDAKFIYVFKRQEEEWLPTDTIEIKVVAAPHNTHFFPKSIAISGNRIIVGDIEVGTDTLRTDLIKEFDIQKEEISAQNTQAYVFQKQVDGEQWEKMGVLSILEGEGLGTAVAISGDYAVVSGAKYRWSYDDKDGAYVFQNIGGEWEEIARLKNDKKKNSLQARSVAIAGNYFIVQGIYQRKRVVYLFEITPTGVEKRGFFRETDIFLVLV